MYFDNIPAVYDENNLQGFSLSSLTGNVPLLIGAAVLAYFAFNKGGAEGVTSLVRKQSIEDKLKKVNIEVASKAKEQQALKKLLGAESAYNQAQAEYKSVKT